MLLILDLKETNKRTFRRKIYFYPSLTVAVIMFMVIALNAFDD